MNLASALLGGVRPERPVLLGPDGTTLSTAADLRSDVERAAGAIAAGTAPGDRVALVLPNVPEFVVGYLATLLAGRIAVPLDPNAPAAELDRQRSSVAPSLQLDVASVRGLVATGQPLDASTTSAAAGTTAVCLFTSGTAGAPRAAQLTHGSLLANIEQVQRAPGLALRPDDITLGLLPLFHVFGLNVVLGLSLHAGAAVSLVEQFHPLDAARQAQAVGATVVAGVPAVYDAWLATSDVPADAFASVRLAVSGAAALATSTQERFRERFAVTIHQGYGLTEASPIVSTTAVDQAVRPGSIGPPLPGVEVRLVADDGDDALTDDPGEIWVRGPNVFAGYWNDPERTAAVLTSDGWLRTGDIAVADADGWLTLVDRSKDLIIVSGFNVFPAEVEGALREHPDIAGAAVVGEPDERSGERVVAFLVAAPGTQPPTPTQLITHLRRRVARYKIPVRFEFVDALPQTFAGKVVRRALRGEANANPA